MLHLTKWMFDRDLVGLRYGLNWLMAAEWGLTAAWIGPSIQMLFCIQIKTTTCKIQELHFQKCTTEKVRVLHLQTHETFSDVNQR